MKANIVLVRNAGNSNIFYNGKVHAPGDKFEYTGIPNIPNLVLAKEDPKPISQPLSQPEQSVSLVGTISEEPVESESYATLGDVESFVSPEAIKAKISEMESTTVVETSSTLDNTKVAEDTPVEVPDIPVINVVEVTRGWYEVQDADGNVLSEKKMRRDDAETLREELYNK